MRVDCTSVRQSLQQVFDAETKEWCPNGRNPTAAVESTESDGIDFYIVLRTPPAGVASLTQCRRRSRRRRTRLGKRREVPDELTRFVWPAEASSRSDVGCTRRSGCVCSQHVVSKGAAVESITHLVRFKTPAQRPRRGIAQAEDGRRGVTVRVTTARLGRYKRGRASESARFETR